MTPTTTAHFLALTGVSYTEEQLEKLFTNGNYTKEDREAFLKTYNFIKEQNFKIPDLPKKL